MGLARKYAMSHLGQATGSSRQRFRLVRFAPKATVGHENAIRR